MTGGFKCGTYFQYQATPFEWHAWVKKCIISKTESKDNASEALRAAFVTSARVGGHLAVNFATMVPQMAEYTKNCDQKVVFDPVTWYDMEKKGYKNVIKPEEDYDYANNKGAYKPQFEGADSGRFCTYFVVDASDECCDDEIV